MIGFSLSNLACHILTGATRSVLSPGYLYLSPTLDINSKEGSEAGGTKANIKVEVWWWDEAEMRERRRSVRQRVREAVTLLGKMEAIYEGMRKRVEVGACARACTHARTHAHTHARTHTHTHTHTHTCVRAID